MLNVSSITLGINERFFKALDILKQQRRLGGIGGFTKRYGMVRGNLYTIKTNKSGAVKAEYLSILVEDFGISGEWLLTGKGEIFKQQSVTPSSPPRPC